MTRVVPPIVMLKAIELEQPLDIRSLYNAASQGRIPWLSHVSPEGHKTRAWWVHVPQMIAYFEARGVSIDLRVKEEPKELERSAPTV